MSKNKKEDKDTGFNAFLLLALVIGAIVSFFVSVAIIVPNQ